MALHHVLNVHTAVHEVNKELMLTNTYVGSILDNVFTSLIRLDDDNDDNDDDEDDEISCVDSIQ